MSSYQGIMGYGQDTGDTIGDTTAQAPPRQGVESEFGPSSGSTRSTVTPNGGVGGVAIALGVVAIGALALFYFRGS